MIRKQGWLAASLVVVVGNVDRPAWSSEIVKSWSGASASTYYNARADSQQGASASASSSYQGIDTVTSATPGGPPFIVSTSGAVAATAGDDPAHLLRVTASVNTGNAGNYHPYSAPDTAGATASWSNDAVLVRAPAGSSLPDAVRLNFTLTFNVSGTSAYDGLTATFNGLRDQVGSQYAISFSHVDSSGVTTANLPPSVDSSNAPATNLPGGLKDTFHVDLPVSSTGLGAPINLGLALSPQVGTAEDQPTLYNLAGNLALTSVTLPDGTTTLASLGDSVSFASGLTPPDPNPVPEPNSLLGWALALATAGAGTTRSRWLARRPA